LARKPNYDFEKRRKEQERKTKKEEKLKRKAETAENLEGGEIVDEFAIDPADDPRTDPVR